MSMRMLFTFAGGAGHFEPLVPIARAAAEIDPVSAMRSTSSALPGPMAGLRPRMTRRVSPR